MGPPLGSMVATVAFFILLVSLAFFLGVAEMDLRVMALYAKVNKSLKSLGHEASR